MTAATEFPKPTAKERKYDRQLRLWAASGQAALESANVLLVNTSTGTVGVETLKNLVLPGVGRFTIADDAVVADADLGVNFFLDQSSLGQPRARCCMEHLVELNPDVTGDWFPKKQSALNLELLFKEEHDFTLIICTMPLENRQFQLVREFAEKRQLPVFRVHCVGFYSYFTVEIPGHLPIVETHPDEASISDLRLLNPWNELSEFCSDMTKNIDILDDHEHGHLPMVAVLLHYLESWKDAHNGIFPSTYADKVAFRERIMSGMKKDNPEGGEENFEEAAAAVMKHINPPALPASMKQVFGHILQNEASLVGGFWVIASAVQRFYAQHNEMPLPGGLPDMKAQSEVYIRLQNIYKKKARQDANQVISIAKEIPGGDQIDLADVELFCKNAKFIKIIKGLNESGQNIETVVGRELANDDVAAVAGPEVPKSLISIYLALRATEHANNATAVGIVDQVVKRIPAFAENERLIQAAEEIARAGSGELHNIAAVTGGMVAQEVIKIITNQYIPVDNACIFDGISSRCQILRLDLKEMRFS